MTASDRPSVGALPNLIIPGFQKCGTSALHYYLGLHPEICASTPKELGYFLAEEDYDAEPFVFEEQDRRLMKPIFNRTRGLDWYASHFDPAARIRVEATVGYTAPWYPGAAAHMAELIPGAQLIFLARDPIERMVSNYMHWVSLGWEKRPIEHAFGRPGNPYTARTRYASALKPYLERYPRERILMLRQEDLLTQRREAMTEVFGFLGVADHWDPRMERKRHLSNEKNRRSRLMYRLQVSRFAASAYRLPSEAKWLIERLAGSGRDADRPSVSPDLRRRVLEELDPEIEEFERITGWDLASWRAPAVNLSPP